MKISKLILALWLAASAWAQAPPPKQQPAKPSGAQAASTSPKAPAPADNGKKPASAEPQNAKGKPADNSAKPPAQSSSRKHSGRQHVAQQPSAPTEEKGKPAGKGVRDPFVSQILDKNRAGAPCVGSGRQCLLIGDIALQGVVQYTSGYIAVVASGDHTYFLHDNDPLADGEVERITKDAITLRQRSTDILGRPVVHQVTRKLGAPAA